MVIIFEGPDNVGKGTQIERVVKKFTELEIPTTVVHCSNFKVEESENKTERQQEISQAFYKRIMQLINLYNEKIDGKEQVLVLDRSHLGETVYAPLYRKYSGNYVYKLEWDIKEPDKVLVLTMVTDIDTLLKREDGKSFTADADKRKLEIDAFVRAANDTRFENSYLLNVSDKSVGEVSEAIDAIIEEVFE